MIDSHEGWGGLIYIRYFMSDNGIHMKPFSYECEQGMTFKILLRVVPDRFFYFSSYKQIAREDTHETNDEEWGIICKHSIKNCHYANHTYYNYPRFVCQPMYNTLKHYTAFKMNHVIKTR